MVSNLLFKYLYHIIKTLNTLSYIYFVLYKSQIKNKMADLTPLINIIARQTDYSDEYITQQLQQGKTVEAIVLQYLKGVPVSEKTPKSIRSSSSVQQDIYREIRHQMDRSQSAFNEHQQQKLSSELKTEP